MSSAEAITFRVKQNIPPDGLVQMITITEKQYSKMEILVGDVKNEYITDDRKLIVL